MKERTEYCPTCFRPMEYDRLEWHKKMTEDEEQLFPVYKCEHCKCEVISATAAPE